MQLPRKTEIVEPGTKSPKERDPDPSLLQQLDGASWIRSGVFIVDIHFRYVPIYSLFVV
ncbi:hypothetical protein F511_33213 [Dorcoceras hygrometricum]|uniref:Uncharacterized protein n=1 Tax=Dorcoceras hygrometricum TaxID=472368 RepID=A0A2Z7A1L3_9LAMI|nr:hypothetical protein F511_33213 [Dorcoceras hygrometricum]